MQTIDPNEINTFAEMKNDWWDEKGPLKGLHELNPARLEFIQTQLLAPLKGLNILDLGCGGGILSEPLARLGAVVTGVDASVDGIEAARAHADLMGLEIHYRAADARELIDEGLQFDVVCSMEVIENVSTIPNFIEVCAGLVKSGGDLFLSTLNKTLKSCGLGIIVAENILGWAPKGAHDWNKFISPADLSKILRDHGCLPHATRGLTYSILNQGWKLSDDVDINYLMHAKRV